VSDGFDVDVLVIGAGPAGSVAAHGCARRGLEVWLVERSAFPRDKVCGCCLNRRAAASLEHAGLGDALRSYEHNTLGVLSLHAAGRGARVKLPGGLAVSRRALDAALVRAARDAGVRFDDRTPAVVGNDGAVTLRRGAAASAVRPRCVIVADGLGGRSLGNHPAFAVRVSPTTRIGLGATLANVASPLEPGTIQMACGRGGYVGMVRLEDGRIDVAAAVDAAAPRDAGGPAGMVASVLDEAGAAVPDGIAQVHWRGTPGLTRRRSPWAAGRVRVVGDAAGYVEPFTGEGMAWAIAGGAAVAAHAERVVRDGPSSEAARAWQRTVARRIVGRQRACRVVSAALRRPRLVGAAVAVLGLMPRAAWPIIGRLNQPSRA